tara:strand:- start:187 stop:1833 length:1647 start_codon:yes stop_codon:yes gene_type:complete
MTTLADVNATLGVTNIALAGVSKNTEKTNEGIVDFLDYLRGKDASDRREEIEAKRETKPFLKSLTGGAAAIGGGLVTAGKSTFGFGKGLLSKLALPAGFIGGFLTSLLSSKLLKGGILGLAFMFGDEIAEMLTGPEAKKQVKDQVAGALKGGALGLLFGPKFALIGGLLGGLIKNDEIDKQAGELVKTLRGMGFDMPKLSNIFKSLNEGVADGLRGINQILKGNFSVDSTVDALKLIGGAALLVSPAGSFFLLRSLARSRVGRILMAIAGLGLSSSIFGGEDKADTTNPSEMRGNELNMNAAQRRAAKRGGGAGGTSIFSLENIVDASLTAYLVKNLYDLGKGAFNLVKRFGLFGKAAAAAELGIGAISKSLANQNKPYRFFKRFQKGMLSSLGRYGLLATTAGLLALPLAGVALVEQLYGDQFRAENEENKRKQNALKAQGTVTAQSKNFYGSAGGFVEDFQYNARNRSTAIGERRFTKETSLQQSNRLLESLNKGITLTAAERATINTGTTSVNSNNINNFNSSSIAMDQSGAFDLRDNLANQLSY